MAMDAHDGAGTSPDMTRAAAWPGDGGPWRGRGGSGSEPVLAVRVRAGGGAATVAALRSAVAQDYPALRLSVIGQPADAAEAAAVAAALARHPDAPTAANDAAAPDAETELAPGSMLAPGALAHAATFFPGCASLSAAAIERGPDGGAVLRPDALVWRAMRGGRGAARSFAPLLLRGPRSGGPRSGDQGGGFADARARWLADPGPDADVPMRRLMLATPTRDRPASLRRCLTSLAAMAPPTGVEVSVLVIDNASAARALEETREIMARWDGPWPASLVVEPEQGIPFARNRAIAEALAAGANALVFLDDDQTVPPDWLATLCHVWRTEAADVVKTPVFWAFDPPARHVEQFFGGSLNRLDRPGPARAVIGRHISTDGVLIGRRLLDDLGLRFSPAMRFSGGSDTEFFARADALGVRAVLTRESYAVEHCPAGKQTLRWLMRRAWRVGAVEGAIRAQGRARARHIAKGLVMAPLHFLAAALTAWRPAAALRHLIKSARAVGHAAGACGLQSREYARTTGR